jgi:hypothetical protein
VLREVKVLAFEQLGQGIPEILAPAPVAINA